jgi:glycosyltransferase involved in cell wall biosynthesis
MESLLNQGFSPQEYEIILVDDGSDDNCPAMCDRYAAQNVQVRVIHQQNKGLSGARNTGMHAAKGTYLCFVDSDDMVVPLSFKPIVETAIAHHLDAIKYAYTILENGITTACTITQREDNTIYTGQQFLDTKVDAQCFSWLYLVRTNFLLKTNIQFIEGIIYEDIDWTPRMLLQVQRMMQVNTCVYYYIARDGSITRPRSTERWRKLVDNYLMILQRLQQTAATAPTCRWFDSMSSSSVSSILTIVAKHLYAERKEYIKRIKAIYPKPLRCSAAFGMHERLKAMVANISPNIYCLIRHFI